MTFAGHAPIDAEPGYVCVTPPNYAPGLFGLVTMDDVVREVFYDKGWIPRPVKTSFVNDVQPIFQRLTGLQWVNHGLFVVHGFGSPLDAQNAQVLASSTTRLLRMRRGARPCWRCFAIQARAAH